METLTQCSFPAPSHFCRHPSEMPLRVLCSVYSDYKDSPEDPVEVHLSSYGTCADAFGDAFIAAAGVNDERTLSYLSRESPAQLALDIAGLRRPSEPRHGMFCARQLHHMLIKLAQEKGVTPSKDSWAIYTPLLKLWEDHLWD